MAIQGLQKVLYLKAATPEMRTTTLPKSRQGCWASAPAPRPFTRLRPVSEQEDMHVKVQAVHATGQPAGHKQIRQLRTFRKSRTPRRDGITHFNSAHLPSATNRMQFPVQSPGLCYGTASTGCPCPVPFHGSPPRILSYLCLHECPFPSCEIGHLVFDFPIEPPHVRVVSAFATRSN